MKLTASDITCIRGGRLVLEGVSFALEPGVASILRGPNGAGKSTLLRVVAGLVEHQEGALAWTDENEVAIDEDEISTASLFHYVGHLDAVKPSLSVQENLAFWGALYGAETDVGPALESLGLGALTDVPGAFLSAGQKKRLSLARVLLGSRPLWVLDEPTVSLDPDGVALVAALMKAHCEHGGSLLVTTHVEVGLEASAMQHLTLDAEGHLTAREEANV